MDGHQHQQYQHLHSHDFRRVHQHQHYTNQVISTLHTSSTISTPDVESAARERPPLAPPTHGELTSQQWVTTSFLLGNKLSIVKKGDDCMHVTSQRGHLTRFPFYNILGRVKRGRKRIISKPAKTLLSVFFFDSEFRIVSDVSNLRKINSLLSLLTSLERFGRLLARER